MNKTTEKTLFFLKVSLFCHHRNDLTLQIKDSRKRIVKAFRNLKFCCKTFPSGAQVAKLFWLLLIQRHQGLLVVKQFDN